MRNAFCKIFLLITILLDFSCKTHIENAETKSIDSVLQVLNQTEEKLNSIDFLKLEEAVNTAKQNVALIEAMHIDSLNQSNSFLLQNYAIVSGEKVNDETELALSNRKEEHNALRKKYIEKEITFCKKQLKNLKGDFESGEMDLASFKKFYEVEKEKSLQIISFVDVEKNSSVHRIAVFDSLHPIMQKFIDSLQNTITKKN